MPTASASNQNYLHSESLARNDRATGAMDELQRSASENADVELKIISDYKFSFERSGHCFTESEQFNISEGEIVNLALSYVNELSPISDLYIADIGFITRIEMKQDSYLEILECEVKAVPKINGLPVYSEDMYIRIIFDNEGIIEATSNLPASLETYRANMADFSEDILNNIVMDTFDDIEVKQAFYIDENDLLIPIYVVECLSDDVSIFRADTGEKIFLI